MGDSKERNDIDIDEDSKLSIFADTKNDQRTLSRNHPISEFLRLKKGLIESGISQDEFAARYDNFCKENGYENDGSITQSKQFVEMKTDMLPANRETSDEKYQGFLKKIVLKFTTLSESGSDAPSFTVDTTGARIGREQSNEVSVPSDVKLAAICHASIEYIDGDIITFLFDFLDKHHFFSSSNLSL